MKKILITGAADGIGRALAFEFGKQGFSIIGVDIDAERSFATQGELIQRGYLARFIQADLSKLNFIESIISQLEPVDVVVHNAGISAVGAFENISWERQERVLDINLRAPIQLTNALLNKQFVNPSGSLIFISSLSHYAGYPGAAVYAASKDGVATYARNLRIALAKQNIHVLTVFPGPTRTTHAHRYSPDNGREPNRMPPHILAAYIFHAAQKKRRQLFPGVFAKVLAWMGLWFPAIAEGIIKKSLFDLLKGRTLT